MERLEEKGYLSMLVEDENDIAPVEAELVE
jgi:hypothetical protein